MAKQKTFNDMGLDATVPASKLPDDIVAHFDGAPIRRADAILDCKGNAHCDEEERHEADVEIVTEVLMAEDKWVEEYTTGDDYGGEYTYLVNERPDRWPALIEEWICDEHGDSMGHTQFDSHLKDIVSAMCDDIDGDEVEAVYDRSEYATYSGSGCCLDGIEIGEYEHQIDINEISELKALHEDGRLDDVLDDVNCDAYVSRSQPRRLNKETGRYEKHGRETYGTDSDYPCLMTYHSPGGQWHFVVSHERMVEAMANAIVTLARRMDSKS